MGGARRTIGILMAAQTVGLVLATVLGEQVVRMVTVTLDGRAPAPLAQVHLGVAMVVVLGLLAAGWLLRPRWARVADPLLTTPITLFVVAQLNGVRDVGALVGIYALASAGVLFAVVQDRDTRRVSHDDGTPSRVPLGLGSAVGIVPWGIVALHQVGAGLVGHPLPGIVVATTLTALAAAIAEFVLRWQGRVLAASVLRTVGMSLVAWLVVLAV